MQLSKGFYYLYPSRQKPTFTHDGRRLRAALFYAVICHCVMFFFCLAIVGFFPMLDNFLMSCVSYSCFLTMRERTTIVYLGLLVYAALTESRTIFNHTLGSI